MTQLQVDTQVQARRLRGLRALWDTTGGMTVGVMYDAAAQH